MTNLREMAYELQDSSRLAKSMATKGNPEMYYKIAELYQKLAKGLNEGQDAIERLAIAEALLRGLVPQAITFDLDADHRAAERRSWAYRNVLDFLAGIPIEPLENGEA